MKSRIDHNKRLRSQTELQSDSKTVRYELKMLIRLAQGFSAIQANPIARSAYIESFAVHCRALIFFLYGHLDEITACGKTEKFARVRDNDVFAIDYHHGWDKDCPPPTGMIVQSKWQADKHVAHIITDRREVNQSGSTKESVWNLSDAVSAICTPFADFLTKVRPQNLDATEMRRMSDLIAEWTSAAKVQFVSPSEPPSVCLQAKTEARTLSPSSAFNIFGKTE